MAGRPLERQTMRRFNAARVFSATKAHDRDRLGDQVTDWLRAHPNIEIEDVVVSQSSDSEFHCLSIVIFFIEARR
jgi:folate-dependent tRNA-U54 methylase TrmFO/GidA